MLTSESATATTHNAVCRMCLGLCGIEIDVEGERVVAVRGDKEHPTSRGYMCPKGHAYPAQHHREDRLSFPTIRGEVVSWAECLDDIAGSIRGLVQAGGPDRLGCYIGTGSASDATGRRYATRLMRELGSAQLYSAATVDIAPLYRAAELVTGFASVFPSWDLESLDEPKLALVIGHNPVVSHGYLNMPNFTDPTRRIRAYRARGGEVWVLDPRRTETATRVDRHLQLRPGTDAAVLAWLVREVLIDGADERELADSCAPGDVERLREAVEPFVLPAVAALAGVAVEDLLDLLHAVRRHRRVVVASGTGVSFGRHAIVAEWLKWALQIITGSLDRPGGMRFPASQPMGAFASPAPPEGAVQAGPASRPELTGLFGERPSAALADEIDAGNVRGLIVGGGRPATAFPNPARVRAALRDLDLCVVVDVFENEMTELATHVLPAAWHLERRDMFFITRQIDSPPVVPPAAERKPTWWIYGQIAKRLGADLFDGALDVDTCTELDVFRHMHGERDDFENLLAAGSHGLDIPRPVGWVHEHVLPAGRWRLTPRSVVERLPQVWERDDAALKLLPRRRLRSINAVAYADPVERPAGPPPVHVSPADAARLGIDEGMRVRVATQRGSLDGLVLLDDTLRPGVVSLTHGYDEVNVGALTDETDIDTLTGQPVQTDVAVTVVPLTSP